ncbi:hypothetical protein FH972_000772 [Carpinus fangiana]|uniref:Uncharacterized protein n=1 Tax=Carpinus fangiana TaxID=176857 RepID=A0A5N6QCT8_9ROSI|nr:hypothetical protein FH972_000772 [Carpinus fangiana]
MACWKTRFSELASSLQVATLACQHAMRSSWKHASYCHGPAMIMTMKTSTWIWHARGLLECSSYSSELLQDATIGCLNGGGM